MTHVQVPAPAASLRLPRPRRSPDTVVGQRDHVDVAGPESLVHCRMWSAKQRVYRAGLLLAAVSCGLLVVSRQGWLQAGAALVGVALSLAGYRMLARPERVPEVERLTLVLLVGYLILAHLVMLSCALDPTRACLIPQTYLWFMGALGCLALTPGAVNRMMGLTWVGHTTLVWLELLRSGAHLPYPPQAGRDLMGLVAIGLLSLLNRYHRMATASMASNQSLRTLALTDDLTGLPNRRAMYQELDRNDGELAVVMIDLDNFKRVNDTAGHEAGDQVLRRVARMLSGVTGEQAVVGRWGGEEFMAVLGARDLDLAHTLAERMRQQVAAHRQLHGVTLSVGVTRQRVGERQETVLHRADELMYEAKQAGKNQVMACT